MSIQARRLGRAARQTAVTPQAISFLPGAIALSSPEIANSGRGQYYWLGIAADPVGWPLVDTYYRDQIPWRAVEISPGVYDLTLIEAGLAEATTRGGRFGFRIMPFFDANTVPEIQPSWIPSLPTTTGPAKAPDWNSPGYLTSWSNMISRVGHTFNGDPRLFYMDISGYGDTGEWFSYAGEYQADITTASAKVVCDAAINAFPDSFVLAPAMGVGATYPPTVTRRAGQRFDYLGCMDLSYQNIGQPAVSDSWKYAPFVTEWGHDSNNFSVTQGIKNIRDLRVSLLSSGNKPINAASMTPSDQQLFDQANKIAGFRYRLTRVDMQTNLTAGGSLAITTAWRNDGVAPTYDVWQAQLVLLAANGARWTIDLVDDLRTVLGTDVPTGTFTSVVTLPSSLPAGTLTAAIRLTDPRGQLAPLQLATTGRDAFGAYAIGSITVASSAAPAGDAAVPATPTITSAAITTSLAPVITGTAPSGSQLRVVVNGRAHLTTATLGGSWSLSPQNYISTGVSYPISVTATSPRGVASSAATQLLEVRGQTIASDDFNRANSSTPGSLPTGQAWTVAPGSSWTIASNHLVPGSSGEHFIVVDAGTPDVIVGVDITGIGASKWMGPIARYVDANNLYMLEISEGSGQVNFFKRVNDSAIYLDACHPPTFSRLALKIRTIPDGVLMIAIADGVVVGHAIDVTAPFPAGTLTGIHYGGFGTPGPTFDNFRVEHV